MDQTADTYLNRAGDRDMVGEVASVEVALQSTNGENELRVLDLLLDRGVTKRAHVYLQDRRRSEKIQLATFAALTPP